ncbi:hypothetical protein ES708_08737 [subsurface metagenome]
MKYLPTNSHHYDEVKKGIQLIEMCKKQNSSEIDFLKVDFAYQQIHFKEYIEKYKENRDKLIPNIAEAFLNLAFGWVKEKSIDYYLELIDLAIMKSDFAQITSMIQILDPEIKTLPFLYGSGLIWLNANKIDQFWEILHQIHFLFFTSHSDCKDMLDKDILWQDIQNPEFREKCMLSLEDQLIERIVKQGFSKVKEKYEFSVENFISDTALAIVIRLQYFFLAWISKEDLDHAINHVRGLILIRFADDFIVMSRTPKLLNKAKRGIESLTKKIGPSLNEKKTKIVTIQQGFSFLGFHFIQYPNKTLWVQPQRERVKAFLVKLKALISTHKQVPTKYLIVGLNSRIRGWTNYYRFCRTHTVYSHIQHLLWRWIWNWCKRRHPKKSKHWVYKHYYDKGDRRWQLVANDFKLRDPFDTKRKSYRWNVGCLSPYDPRKGVQELWKKKKLGEYYA